ncbi:hypothetical protein [Saccharicrinis fermentans]|uniref:Uncharacterized protein n=1 Tax=Saccharicrinis fermentans DSM 9555 = JCM 21142 TaxID=869213 RepID=W7YCX5_9BACT|nr:hypothetical protein [Saccharicrinis fermentans]GAF05333.1 hypothetical protein JCM21142_104064 [Saccharicrinis fermentans DSM 9555 = JCM 21142]
MDAKKKKILFISGGVLTTGAIVTTIVLIRRRNKRKRGLLPQGGSDKSPANILTTNNNALPPNFKNWNGSSTYLASMPRGIRNNNPGNIIQSNSKWHGKLSKDQNKDRRFEMFMAPEYGVRAMIKLLQNYMGKGFTTVEKIVKRYAPSFENNTKAYINTVCKDLKVQPQTKLRPTKNTLRLLVLSMTKVENGKSFITPQLFEQAYSMI